MSSEKDHLQSCCPLVSQALDEATSHAHKASIPGTPDLQAEHLLAAMHTKRPPHHPKVCPHAMPLLQGKRLLAAHQPNPCQTYLDV